MHVDLHVYIQGFFSKTMLDNYDLILILWCKFITTISSLSKHKIVICKRLIVQVILQSCL